MHESQTDSLLKRAGRSSSWRHFLKLEGVCLASWTRPFGRCLFTHFRTTSSSWISLIASKSSRLHTIDADLVTSSLG